MDINIDKKQMKTFFSEFYFDKYLHKIIQKPIVIKE